MGQISLFLGTEFSWTHRPDGNLTVHLTQQSFAETLIDSMGWKVLVYLHFLVHIDLVF